MNRLMSATIQSHVQDGPIPGYFNKFMKGSLNSIPFKNGLVSMLGPIISNTLGTTMYNINTSNDTLSRSM